MRFRTGNSSEGFGIVRYTSEKSEREVAVPDGVRFIGRDAFRGQSGIARVILPDSLRVIESHAFADCASLEEVVSGKDGRLRSLGRGAFMRCLSLRSVLLPDSFVSAERDVFHGCPRLTDLGLPLREDMELSCFSDCYHIKRLILGGKIYTMDSEQLFRYGSRLIGFMIRCHTREGYLLRRHYGFDIDEGFLHGFVFELYGYGHADARRFIEERFEEMLRGEVRRGNTQHLGSLLGCDVSGELLGELIDLAAALGHHEVYLTLLSHRHDSGKYDGGGRFSL